MILSIPLNDWEWSGITRGYQIRFRFRIATKMLGYKTIFYAFKRQPWHKMNLSCAFGFGCVSRLQKFKGLTWNLWVNKSGERKTMSIMTVKKLFNNSNLEEYFKIVIKTCLLYLLARKYKVVYFKICHSSEKQSTRRITLC